MSAHLRNRLLLIVACTLSPLSLADAAGGGGMGNSEAPSISTPRYDAAEQYATGVAALQAQDYKGAKTALGRVVAQTPANTEAWRMLGAADAGLKDYKGARKAYGRAVKLDPDNIDSHLGLGLALAGLKDAKAKDELAWLKAKADACAGTCAEADGLKAASGQLETALASGVAALAPAPMLFAGPAGGDRAYMTAVSLINEHRYDDALASLAQAREAFGPHPDILTYQGYAWRKKGDYDRAEGYYRQALAIAPHHRGATEYYGELKVERGDLAGAKVMLARLDKACAFGCAEAEELRRWIDAGHEPRG